MAAIGSGEKEKKKTLVTSIVISCIDKANLLLAHGHEQIERRGGHHQAARDEGAEARVPQEGNGREPVVVRLGESSKLVFVLSSSFQIRSMTMKTTTSNLYKAQRVLSYVLSTQRNRVNVILERQIVGKLN